MTNDITPRHCRLVTVWAVGCLALYAGGAILGARHLRSDAREAAKIRQSRMESLRVETAAPQTGDSIPSTTTTEDVRVGLSLVRVGEIEPKENVWTADFIVSFRWEGEGAHPVDGFRIANGEILKMEKRECFENGSEHYEEYAVEARITRDSGGTRFPIANVGLLIDVEDTTSSGASLGYVAEKIDSEVRPGAIPHSVELIDFAVGTRISNPPPVPLRPKLNGGTGKTHSHFFFAMLVEPDRAGIYMRLFRALFGAVAIAFIVLFIKPHHVDPRFGLPVGGFFAAVTNTVSISTTLPYSDRITLVDMVNMAGLFTIALILVQSAISLHVEDSGRERLSRFFDRVTFAVLFLGYAALNLILPISARPL